MERYCARLLAKNLKKLRGERSQKEFARRIGVPHSQLNRIEQGVINTSLKTIEAICDNLRCEPKDLFQMDEEIVNPLTDKRRQNRKR